MAGVPARRGCEAMNAAAVATPLAPDPAQMLAHLHHLFAGDLDGCHDGLVELAWTDHADGRLRHAALFPTDRLDELVERAVTINSRPGQNLYIGQALRRPEAPPGRCGDADVLTLIAFYTDLDDDIVTRGRPAAAGPGHGGRVRAGQDPRAQPAWQAARRPIRPGQRVRRRARRLPLCPCPRWQR